MHMHVHKKVMVERATGQAIWRSLSASVKFHTYLPTMPCNAGDIPALLLVPSTLVPVNEPYPTAGTCGVLGSDSLARSQDAGI